ncbi:MAG TPA: HAMP domain-containing sensor histidine kinase [Candidatus Rubrimentiphilum sp.]|nr:HAMP domain-containing sensor histidine kinase [Candidatus Rubrimentiphilum sp.]
MVKRGFLTHFLLFTVLFFVTGMTIGLVSAVQLENQSRAALKLISARRESVFRGARLPTKFVIAGEAPVRWIAFTGSWLVVLPLSLLAATITYFVFWRPLREEVIGLSRSQDILARQFLTDAGHELRTPLTVLGGYTEVLDKMGTRDPEVAAKLVTTMREQVHLMTRTIDRLLLMARLDRPLQRAASRTDVSDIAERLLRAFEPLAKNRLVARIEPGCYANVDENELYEAISNVVENALKYAPQSAVDLRVTQREDRIEIVVGDNGPGMDKADLERAFDRFFRGSARADISGSGIGLSIAKVIVERYGGSIALESEPGTGTRVTISLPNAT